MSIDLVAKLTPWLMVLGVVLALVLPAWVVWAGLSMAVAVVLFEIARRLQS